MTSSIQSNLFSDRSPTFQSMNDDYLLPNDTKEMERLEAQHEAFLALTNQRLILAPVKENVKKVIDIGCGSGIVTRELQRQFKHADRIYGIDLTETSLSENADQTVSSDGRGSSPLRAPAEFIHGDFLKLAGADERLQWGTFDFVWSRFLLCGMKDWPGYTDRVFKLLRPGARAQLVDFCEDFYFDAELSQRAPGFVPRREWPWLKALHEGGRRKGLDLDAGRNIPEYMKQSGFVDVESFQFRCPFWREAKEERPETARVIDLHIDDPYALYWHMVPRMVEGLGFTEDEVKQFQQDSRTSMGEEKGKNQILYVTIGRKPEGSTSES